jgi:pimeloyl-ACP methyl ester carboxylesterase
VAKVAVDIKNYYVEKGQGDPLILLHGNGEDSTYFVKQIDEFAKYFHVYAVDTRGHGQTPRGTAPFTIRQIAKDLADFMDEQGIEKADILGFSDGGNIALIFAIKYPEKVNRLIADGANLDTTGIVPKLMAAMKREYDKAVKEGEKSDPEGQANREELFSLMVNDPNIPVSELAGIKAKTLIMAGTKDMIPEEHTKMIAENIEGARCEIIEGDHFIAAGNPKEFNSIVLGFLREEK